MWHQIILGDDVSRKGFHLLFRVSACVMSLPGWEPGSLEEDLNGQTIHRYPR